MFFGGAIFTKAFDGFAGHFIDIILLFRFGLKIIIRAVIETDRSISFDNVIAFFQKDERYTRRNDLP